MNFGLSPDVMDSLARLFSAHPEVEQAVLYGSRAKGTHRNGSDIDLALSGELLTEAVLGAIADEIDDLMLPYTVDLSVYEAITNENLRDHIDRVGIPVYRKRETREGGLLSSNHPYRV
jgi:uncharacterized protein